MLYQKKIIVALFFAVLFFRPVFSDQFKNVKYQVCFTPGEDCTKLVVDSIAKSKKTLLVQAYSFTSAPIAKALVDAKKRGVDVKVILDTSQFSQKYSSSKFLMNQGIPIWDDHKVAIAHNKVMIIDNQTVITGSFNFTKAAQAKNAENLVVIDSPDFAAKYARNWAEREALSSKVN
jgi:phosphatidylserine/phosphatidylglycerophosphate/cardiolipin synthase-like enzyme